jgi:hypothetical protein
MTPEQLKVLIEALPQAQTLDLYRLEHAIRSMYNEPRRVVAIRSQLHLGMTVQFFDGLDGAFHSGRIVALRDQGMTIDEPARNLRHTGVPYAALDLRTPPPPDVEIVHAQPARPPAAKAPTRADFKVGDKVTFNDRHQVPITGTITRINQKSITVVPDHQPGQWRVSPSLLRHVIDV